MSTPPFTAIPDGVALLTDEASPLPLLLADGAATPARRSVLLVPGFTGSKEDYIALIGPLAAHGWRVAAMDLPGQGAVPGLGPRGSHSPQTLADAVARVAAWLAPAEPVHLVAHSMGGLVAREYLIRDPAAVASFTMVCSGPGAVPGESFQKLLQLQAALAALPMTQVWALKESLDRAGGWNPPSAEVAAFCAERFIANDPAALADSAEILMTALDRTREASEAMRLQGITGAVITGALDDAWPLSQQEEMASRLGVPWVVMPGVGHNPSTESPAEFAAVLDRVFNGYAK